MSELYAKPFLKWAGGKTQLIAEIARNLPREIESEKFVYVEPFVGSGAVLFWMLSSFANLEKAVINDVNADLINVYKVVAREPRQLIRVLETFQAEFHALQADASGEERLLLRETRLLQRARFGRRDARRAVRFLNCTCFNGLYRINRSNLFNVPMGSYDFCFSKFDTMKQHEAVVQTLERLGGIATLGQLNQEVFKIKDCEWKTKTPFASVRRIVQTNSAIYKIKPGLYGLKSHKQQNEASGIVEETAQNKDSREVAEFNHSYYQGLLLTIGNLKHYQTFLPNQDKNRLFLKEKLGDLSTLNQIPSYSYENLVKRSQTIDVIWFNERKMPHSFFEVEHSTDIQNSLIKFNDLQDFSARMFIVADNARKKEFESKINYAALKDIRTRVQFVDYETLAKQYEQAIESTKLSVVI